MAKPVKTEPKFCFIISHIGGVGTDERKDADSKLKHLFEPVLKDNYNFTRSDKESTPGFISTQIIKRLIESEIVISDISFENANVFYELAVRHAIKKPVIIIKKPGQKPPFDITDIRAIDVDMKDPDIWQPAKQQLAEYLKEAEKDPTKASESILSNFSKSFNLQSADDKESDTLRTVKDIKAQLNRMSSDVDSLKDKTSNVIDGDPGTYFFGTRPKSTTGTFTFGGNTTYSLKCKKCNRIFNTVNGPATLIGLVRTTSERCPHCQEESIYKNEDYTREDVVF